MSLSTAPPGDRHAALQQRQRTTEILTQKIEVNSRGSFFIEVDQMCGFRRCFVND